MACQKQLTLNPASAATEMPLDNCIVATSAGGQFLFGVRGPYVFKINATTGILISSAKVDTDMFGPVSIAYNSVTDKLLIAGWNKPFPGITTDEVGPNAGNTYFMLYSVNPSTLLVDSSVMLNTALNTFPGNIATQSGVVAMKWMGSGAQEGLWGIYRTNETSQLFRYVTGTAYTRKWSSSACFGEICNDLAWDGITTLFWAQSFQDEVQSFDMTSNAGSWNTVNLFSLWTADSSIPFGIEVAPSTGDVYAGTQNGLIKRLGPALGSIVSTLNTGATGIVHKIRYNPFDGNLYCTIMSQDTVAVVDPGTNTLVGALHTGYDSPWDVIFTATKTWVVQQGNLGIKLFT